MYILSKVLTTLLCGVALLLVPSTVASAAPNVVSYQGQLLDAAGDPVPDDVYFLKFKIYGSESGTDSLWWSGIQAVPVTKGLLDYDLGSIAPLPVDLFAGSGDRYLGITVGADPEISPRTEFTSVAYSRQSYVSDVALVAYDVNCVGCVSSQDIANYSIQYEDLSNNSVASDNIINGSVIGNDIAGYTIGLGNMGSNSVNTANIVQNTILAEDIAGNAIIGWNIQDGTITDDDIQDEPGLASSYLYQTTIDDSAMLVDSVIITAPTVGFVMVSATARVGSVPESSRHGNFRFDISLSPSLSIASQAVVGSNGELANDGSYRWFSMHVTEIYAVSAGEHTFYLKADQGVDDGFGLVNYISTTALFFPTAYGSFSKFITNDDGESHQIGTPVSFIDESVPGGETVTGQVVDLRELEGSAVEEK